MAGIDRGTPGRASGDSNATGQYGWSVGIFEWLNSPGSKVNRYWRLIENGGTENVGRHIIGLWGPNPGTNARPNSIIERPVAEFAGGYRKFVPFVAKEGADPLQTARRAFAYLMDYGHGPAMALLNPKMENIGGRKPTAAAQARERLRMYYWFITKAPLNKIPFVQGMIGRPMLAQQNYIDAARTMNPAALTVRNLAAILPAALQGAMGLASPATAAQRFSQAAGAPGRMAGGEMMVALSTPMLGRDAGTQRWNTLQSAITEVNRQCAIEFQEVVVATMIANKGTRYRPPTHDLIQATKDARNRYPK